jgi:hypothetical protein
MSLELPVLRLGLAGFTSEQQQQLGSMLNRAVSGGLAWDLGGFSEADAWWINGARTQLLADGTLRVASGVPGGRSTQLNLQDIDRPVAFAHPLAPRNFEPAFSFDPGSKASVEQVLVRMEGWLRPAVAQYCLASQIIEQESVLGPGTYHVSAGGKLLAVVNLRGDVGVLPTAEPSEFEDALWNLRPASAGMVPETFVRTSLSHLMWQYAVRTTRDLLPKRYRTEPLYFRRPPRLPQRMIKDAHLLLLRELAGAPGSFAELEQRTGLKEESLAQPLAALYLVGSITSNPKRAGQLAGRRTEAPDSGHGLQHSVAPDTDPGPVAPQRPRFADLTAPAPMGLE